MTLIADRAITTHEEIITGSHPSIAHSHAVAEWMVTFDGRSAAGHCTAAAVLWGKPIDGGRPRLQHTVTSLDDNTSAPEAEAAGLALGIELLLRHTTTGECTFGGDCEAVLRFAAGIGHLRSPHATHTVTTHTARLHMAGITPTWVLLDRIDNHHADFLCRTHRPHTSS